MSYSTPSIRNVALAGHPAAGKTTLFEALLQAGGTLQTAGTIERGNTVSDFDPMERERGHSLDAAIASIDHKAASGESIHVNLIDTPGYPDFRGPALSALAAVETVLMVVDADQGVRATTRTVSGRGSIVGRAMPKRGGRESVDGASAFDFSASTVSGDVTVVRRSA